MRKKSMDGLMGAAEGLTDQLVVDLSTNGGGYMALADLVLQALDADYRLNWKTVSKRSA
jgi:C-terminal processing protease CtpA/Prc